MTTEMMTSTETTEAPASAAPEVSAPETPETSTPEGTTTEPGQAQKPAWTPSYKFKAFDKEMEIPEHFRSLIKDEKSLKEVKELFEKAHGLDGYKQRYSTTVKEKEQFQGTVKQYESRLQQAQSGLQKLYQASQNDLDTFFEAYKIPEEKLFQYVSQKLKEQELPVEDRQRIEQGRKAQREAMTYQERLQQAEQQNHQLFVSQHEMQMNMVMSQPTVTSFQSQFDQRFGQGEFRRHVDEYGDKLYRQGKYVAPQDAVRAVYSYYSKMFQNNPTPSQPQAGQAGVQGQAPAQSAAPPSIPNVGSGRSVSPTKPKFKDLDSLRKYVKENFNEG